MPIVGKPFILGSGSGIKSTDAVVRVKAPTSASVVATKSGVPLSFNILYYLDSSTVVYYAAIPSKQFDSDHPWVFNITYNDSQRTKVFYINAPYEYNIAINWNVPEGYTEVEYIECTAASDNTANGIDTVGIKPPFATEAYDTTHFVGSSLAVKCAFSTKNDCFIWYMSSRSGRMTFHKTGGKTKYMFYRNGSQYDTYTYSSTNPIEYKLVGNTYRYSTDFIWSFKVYHDNILDATSSDMSGMWYDITSFNGFWYGGGAIGTKIYYLRGIKSDGTASTDCVACRDPNGTLGFYDKVTQTFHSCSSKKTFVAGPDVI